jgi:hypothetical protein
VPGHAPDYQYSSSGRYKFVWRRDVVNGKMERRTIGPAAGGFVLLGETGEAADTCGSTLESRARG